MAEENEGLVELLTISFKDYLKKVEKKASDYELFGVQSSFGRGTGTQYSFENIEFTEKRALEEFYEELPEGTEVVVDLRKDVNMAPGGFWYGPFNYVSYLGTALVPNEEHEEETSDD